MNIPVRGDTVCLNLGSLCLMVAIVYVMNLWLMYKEGNLEKEELHETVGMESSPCFNFSFSPRLGKRNSHGSHRYTAYPQMATCYGTKSDMRLWSHVNKQRNTLTTPYSPNHH